MSLRNPLAVARNHGAAKDGVHHWWVQRLSALILIPLTIWLLVAICMAGEQDYEGLRAWLALPWNTVAALLLNAMLFYHGQLGVQVVIEDYIDARWLEVSLQILVKFGALVFSVMGTLAILRIAFNVAPLGA